MTCSAVCKVLLQVFLLIFSLNLNFGRFAAVQSIELKNNSSVGTESALTTDLTTQRIPTTLTDNIQVEQDNVGIEWDIEENLILDGGTDDASSSSTNISVDFEFETTTPEIKSEVEIRTTTTTPEPALGQCENILRPNVILIIADDLGFNDVSFHGSTQIPTPNIDALAFSGVILNSYYVSPICTPSRSAIFSGRHPIHTGMQHNVIYGTTPYGFPLKYKLLPEYLKDLGYDTALVGKWHLGHYKRQYTPTYRGFDSHYGHWTGHKDYYDNTAQETGPQAWGYDMRRNLETTYENFGKYTTDVYTEEATKIIRNRNKSRPLFITLSHTAVHSANPYQLLQAPKENVDNFSESISNVDRRTFAAMVQKLDESVGSVVKVLAEEEMLNNTILIFTTDNGGPAAGFNGNAASNWPLRGVKNTLWEGGVRGAGLIWSPMINETARGSSRQLIHIQDWLPTILRAVGVAEPHNMTGFDIDGLDLWDALSQGKASPRTEILHNIDDLYGNEGVRVGPWKLLHGTTYGGKWDGWYGPSGREDEAENKCKKCASSRRDIFHLAQESVSGRAILDLGMFPSAKRVAEILNDSRVRCKSPKKKNSCDLRKGEFCLFNIHQDPCEYNNLAKDLPKIVEKLKEVLKRYRKSQVAPINKPKDPRGLPVHWNYTWTNWVDFLEEEKQAMVNRL